MKAYSRGVSVIVVLGEGGLLLLALCHSNVVLGPGLSTANKSSRTGERSLLDPLQAVAQSWQHSNRMQAAEVLYSSDNS